MTVPEHLRRFPTRAAIDSLAQRFGLPNDPRMQDWEYQVADAARLDEFLDAYETVKLSDDERVVLMEMILQSFEELAPALDRSAQWARIATALHRNITTHIHTVWYWACPDDDVDLAFRIAPMVRTVLERHRRRFESPPS